MGIKCQNQTPDFAHEWGKCNDKGLRGVCLRKQHLALQAQVDLSF